MQNAAILFFGTSRCWLNQPIADSRSAMVGLVRVVPIVTFLLVAGVIADARDKRRLMLFTQTGWRCRPRCWVDRSRTPQLRQYRASVHLTPADDEREGGLS